MNHGMWNERMLTAYNRTSMARIPLEPQNHVRKTMFEAGVARASECPSWRQVRRQNRNIFSIFFKINVHCLFSLESPQWGDSNEYTQYTIFNIKKEITQNYPKSAAMRFFPRDSRMSSKQPWKTSHQCSSHWGSTVLSQSGPGCSKPH